MKVGKTVWFDEGSGNVRREVSGTLVEFPRGRSAVVSVEGVDRDVEKTLLRAKPAKKAEEARGGGA